MEEYVSMTSWPSQSGTIQPTSFAELKVVTSAPQMQPCVERYPTI